MQQIRAGSATILVVEVEKGGIREAHVDNEYYPSLIYFYGFTVIYREIKLPRGEWEYVNTLKDITEEQAAGIVEKSDFWNRYGVYLDYINKRWLCYTALESLRSLLKANGIEGDNHVILKLTGTPQP